MTHLHKLTLNSIFRRILLRNNLNFHIPQIHPHDYFCPNSKSRPLHSISTAVVQWENPSCDDDENLMKKPHTARKLAQAALLDYLHCTRSLQFTDAEHICKNSPEFLERLVAKVANHEDKGMTIYRFLRYHPINEYEPFFESLGLKQSEYIRLLPKDKMFLSDDDVLLENCGVLLNYGIARNKIGRVYKGAREVFGYESGVLSSKIRDYENLGLSRCSVAKIIVSSPYILTGDGVNKDVLEVLERLRSVGFELNWFEEQLSDCIYYRWSQILETLGSFRNMGLNGEQLHGLLSKCPGILFDGSGDRMLSLTGTLFKFGYTMDDLRVMFLNFPKVEFGEFLFNLRRCFSFLVEIDMDAEDINRILRTYTVLLGTIALKKPNTVLAKLNVGKKRLANIIKEDPQEMKNWVMGSNIQRLPDTGDEERSFLQKIKFLSGLGFPDNSEEMKRALKLFRGRGGELQERFDCLVTAGLEWRDVIEMVRVSPQILNQSKDMIEMKMDFLVNHLGYPLSILVSFPSYLSYKIERVESRHLMYKWLKDQGVLTFPVSLCSIVTCTEKKFICQYVHHHPRGMQVWQALKEKIGA